MTTNILHHNGHKKQSSNSDAFSAAFIPQTNGQSNTDLEKALFISQKVCFYKQELERLQADLKKTEVLLRGHETWLSELVKKLEVQK